jgi:hypothetical protein
VDDGGRSAHHRHEVGVEKMNVFTIIGIVVVVILIAGYFGIHGF